MRGANGCRAVQALSSVRSYHMIMALGLKPEEMRSRLMTELTALGIVCALLASLAFSIMSAPPDSLVREVVFSILGKEVA